jgi:hypothetical protein
MVHEEEGTSQCSKGREDHPDEKRRKIMKTWRSRVERSMLARGRAPAMVTGTVGSDKPRMHHRAAMAG